jgi:hypothetical protein
MTVALKICESGDLTLRALLQSSKEGGEECKRSGTRDKEGAKPFLV